VDQRETDDKSPDPLLARKSPTMPLAKDRVEVSCDTLIRRDLIDDLVDLNSDPELRIRARAAVDRWYPPAEQERDKNLSRILRVLRLLGLRRLPSNSRGTKRTA
jgi:hypothetical protein